MPPLRPILLVEDNLSDIELTLAALKKNNLANPVDVVRHGGEALDYLRQQHPVVVLLDLKMPKVDGLEVLRHMKGDAAMKMIPAVMLTSSREEADVLESYRLGVNAFVVKPVDFQEFTNVIGQLGVFWALINEPPPPIAPGG